MNPVGVRVILMDMYRYYTETRVAEAQKYINPRHVRDARNERLIIPQLSFHLEF